MSSTCEECLKNVPEVAMNSQWAYLPSVPLTAVFGMLNKTERKMASVVCRNWRDYYFLPRWWKSITIIIQPDELKKARFRTSTFGQTATVVTIVLKSLSKECLQEFINLLSQLSRNNNLKSLRIDPSRCLTENPFSQDLDRADQLAEVTNLLKLCLPKLRKFFIRCKEVLSICMETILVNLDPSLVTILELANGRDDSTNVYHVNQFDPALLKPFTKLEKLGIGCDNVSDELLDILATATKLKELIIHYRVAFERTDISTNNGWIRFIQHHPETEIWSVYTQPTWDPTDMPFTSSTFYLSFWLRVNTFGFLEKHGIRLQQ